MPLLDVQDLTVTFPTSDGPVRAVRGLDLSIDAGTTLGIVGESGSGKSVTALTLLGLGGGGTVTGRATFDGLELIGASQKQLREVRGAGIGMIFQDPLSALHPHFKVGWQIVEMIRAHTTTSRAEARQQAIDLLRMVAIPEPEKRIDAYAHELSGGMRQRVMIAMALALRPKLLIADEPTTALDATVQAQIIQLLGRLQVELGMAMMIITHDLGVIARIATYVLVMYAGRGAELADRSTIFYSPHHPYTCGLLRSIPAATGVRDRLRPIPGQPPSLIAVPSGCAFHPRCTFAMTRCSEQQPEMAAVDGADDHGSACFLPHNLTGNDDDVATRRAEAAKFGNSDA